MASDQTLNTFFIPGTGEDNKLVERVYADMQAELEIELGARPQARRIAKLWTRRGSTDCITEVGVPDPLRGGMVMAIFDMGHHKPFVVWLRPHEGMPSGVREILGHYAYAVVEFDA